MSVCDPYLELELYLEKAHNEIIQVFENSVTTPKCFKSNEETAKIDNKCYDIQLTKDEENEWETDSFLLQFESRMKSDINDLLTRYELRKKIVNNQSPHIINEEESNFIITNLSKDSLYIDVNVMPESEFFIEDLNESKSTLNSLHLLNETNSTNTTGTQTSPSQSSTNLTCWSDCSSPCILSVDQDIADDTISLTSADGLDEKSSSWSRNKHYLWQQELSIKSSSAPVLKRAVAKVNKQARSQSDRHLSEVEATEACKWLRAAGFPQYAQMYEDHQFPVDIAAAEQDHPMLEPSVLNSLFRRLQALNRCAKVHQQRVTHVDDSEDEQCALSYNWTYQKDIRRWSRIEQTIDIPSSIVETDPGITSVIEQDSSPPMEEQSRFRRMNSTRHRRRNRDGLVISDSGSNVLDFLSKQLSSLTSTDTEPALVSSSECTLKYNRKKKTRSLDKTDNWAPYSPSHSDRINFKPLTNTEEVEETRLDLEEGGRPIFSLSCTQLHVLRKLALLKLTAIMEKHCPSHRSGFNWDLPKLIRKMKGPVYKEKLVFGVPLGIILQRSGSAMPRGIEEALQWLQQSAYDQVGLFRKSGVKSRIQNLKHLIETQGECVNFSEYQAYDIADMVKQYFRELPEALLTTKLSETFLSIFQYIPEEERRQAVLCAVLLLPNEHYEVLLGLLKFLNNIAEHSAVNQMNESNLAVCFAPSLFYYSSIPASRQGLGVPHPRELAENKAAHDCLLFLMEHCNNLLNIPKELLKQCTSNEMKETIAMQLSEMGVANDGWREYLQECEKNFLTEIKEKGWIPIQNYYSRVELAFKKVADNNPLRLWKISCEVEAPPGEVLYRILKERPKWDEELHSTRTVAQIDKNVEIFQYARRNIAPLPLEDYCVVRTWRTDLPKGACVVIETSVEHTDAINIPNSQRGIVLASRYFIEPCGSGKSRLIHLSRVDTRGRMPEWYHKHYGHICALYISNIQTSFKQNTIGPESKV